MLTACVPAFLVNGRALAFFGLSLLTACVTQEPAVSEGPNRSSSEITYALFGNDEWISSGQTNRNLLGRGTGYRWIWGLRCPVSGNTSTPETTRLKFAAVCAGDGGKLDAKGLCRAKEDSESVLYAAKFGATDRCGDVVGIGFEIVTPTSGYDNSNYIRRLREYGFLRKQDKENAVERLLGQVERRSKQGNIVLRSEPGTRVCKQTIVRYMLNEAPFVLREEEGTVVGELLAVEQNNIKFKVVELQIPNQSADERGLSTGYRAEEMNVNPGDVAWDDAWHEWQVCE